MKPRKLPSAHPFEPPEEEIQRSAYFLWMEEGRPSGRDLDLWLQAKELLRHRMQSPHVHGGRAISPPMRKRCADNGKPCEAARTE